MRTHVDEKTLVVLLVGTRQRNGLVGLGPTVAFDLQLSAGWVELSTAAVLGDVKGDDFVTDEVVARGEVGGNLHSGWGSGHYHKRIRYDRGVTIWLYVLRSF